MKLEYFIVAENVIIDSQTNKTTIVNIIEEITAPTSTNIIAECAAASLWRVDAGDSDRDWQATLRVELLDKTKHEFTLNFRVEAGSRRHRLIQRFRGMPIDGYGELRFEILLNGEHHAEHVIAVTEGSPDFMPVLNS